MHWLGPYVIKEIIGGGLAHLSKLNNDPFSRRVNGSQLKPYTEDPTQSLHDGNIVLALQVAAKKHETINYTS